MNIILRIIQNDLAGAVRRGLTAAQKWLPCKFFYDAAGMALFEEICELPEYDLTRNEAAILRGQAADILALCPGEPDLVELGSGSSRKTRYLIEPLLARQHELTYYAIDVAADALTDAEKGLLSEFPGLHVVGLAGEFADGLAYLAGQPGGPRLVAFLGSTIGNFDEEEIARFLAMLRKSLRPQDRFLLGVDLRKDPAIHLAAYDDAQGVTARFNLNLLAVVNRHLGGDFDLDAFRHRAVFNAERGRVEMHLVSTRHQVVRLEALDLAITFGPGETIHTENCYKHTQAGMTALLGRHGFAVRGVFTDAGRRFAMFLAS